MNTVKRIMNTVNPTRSATAEPPANGPAPASVMAPTAPNPGTGAAPLRTGPALPSTEPAGRPAGATRSAADISPPTTVAPHRRRVRRSRIGALWVGVIAAAIVLILLLIFILQNSRRVQISYVGMHGHLSLAVAMLLSAIAGVLLVAIPGTARILQLRRGVRRGQPARR